MKRFLCVCFFMLAIFVIVHFYGGVVLDPETKLKNYPRDDFLKSFFVDDLIVIEDLDTQFSGF